MKKFILLLLLITIISCNKDDSITNLGQNEDDIIQYIEENNLNATRSESGVYYVIDEQGEGESPNTDYYATVNYKGYLLDGSVFDESAIEGVEFDLQNVITGFAEGISYFNEGGKGIILIPPSLAFGNYTTGDIPGGAVLVFEIDLIKVTDAETEGDILVYLETNGLEAESAESGLYYEIENPGEGDPIAENSIVTVKYTAYFLDGTEFDASDDDGIQFKLQDVIPGFSEGLTYFKKGGNGRLFIPPSLAYGEEGVPNRIKRGAVLIFDIEIISLND